MRKNDDQDKRLLRSDYRSMIGFGLMLTLIGGIVGGLLFFGPVRLPPDIFYAGDAHVTFWVAAGFMTFIFCFGIGIMVASWVAYREAYPRDSHTIRMLA